MIRLAVFVFFSGICFHQLNAQNSSDNYFSQLNISVGYLPMISSSSTDIGYTAKDMYRLSVGANYGKGFFKLNFQYGQMLSENTWPPDCNTYNTNFAYHYHISLFKFMDAYAGIETGLYTTQFKDSVASYREFETEMLAGAELGIEAKLTSKLSLTCAYRIQRVFSSPRVDMTFGDIGLTYYFNKSETVKKWLQ